MKCPICNAEKTLQEVYESWNPAIDVKLCVRHTKALAKKLVKKK